MLILHLYPLPERSTLRNSCVTPKFLFEHGESNCGLLSTINISCSSSGCWQNLVYDLVCRTRWLQMHSFCLQWTLLYSHKFTQSRMQWLQDTGQAALSWEQANVIIRRHLSVWASVVINSYCILGLRAGSSEAVFWRWNAVPKEEAAALSAPLNTQPWGGLEGWVLSKARRG